MEQFVSQTLNRTFARISLGSLVPVGSTGGETPAVVGGAGRVGHIGCGSGHTARR